MQHNNQRAPNNMRIGIDVGGTNTDTVLIDHNTVIGKVKLPTTADVSAGIHQALTQLLAQHPDAPIDAVMIGTTHFVNAVIEQRELAPVAAVRLCLPAGQAIPPRTDWPAGLSAQTGDLHVLCHGGREFDGRPLSPLNHAELRTVGQQIAAQNIRQIALTSIFSSVQAADEQQAADILREVVPQAEITLSHEVGRTGLLERENATILNSSLRPLAQRTIDAFESALHNLGLESKLYLTQNDGTVMTAAFARRFPVFTFASGPTNSMRGAAFLSGLKDAMVVDIGGTTTDVGALISGFPREAAGAVQVGGVRTNFRMPDVYSIGLGGGSLVTAVDHHTVAIGPRSVGHRLTAEALVFGGTQTTATDIAVAAGLTQLGTHTPNLQPDLVTTAQTTIKQMVIDAIDRMKVAQGDVPVVLVGGGSILVDDDLPGTTAVYRPDHYEAANAVGAAIAQISGEIDKVYQLDGRTRADVMAEAKADATTRAIAAGAQPHTVQIVDVYDVPLAYLPANATRVHVKAVGDA